MNQANSNTKVNVSYQCSSCFGGLEASHSEGSASSNGGREQAGFFTLEDF